MRLQRAPHEQTTLRLARAVLARDAELEWALLTQPQRLRIDTLDAFNVWLAQQLPVLADGVAAADIVDKPDAALSGGRATNGRRRSR